MSALRSRLHFAQSLARKAGQHALELHRKHRNDAAFIAAKGAQDFVTLADKSVEEMLISSLSNAFPEDDFLGEEGGRRNLGSKGTAGIWVIDPIDGTTNYMRGLCNWGISLAYVLDNTIELAVVYVPALNQLYHASRGAGAFCNDLPIKVSTTSELSRALVGLGRSERTELDPYLDLVREICTQGGEYRRNGSAALSLLEVAAGLTDAYFERHVNAWDIFAACLLVEEAGGSVRMPSVEACLRSGGGVLATNGLIAPHLPAACQQID